MWHYTQLALHAMLYSNRTLNNPNTGVQAAPDSFLRFEKKKTLYISFGLSNHTGWTYRPPLYYNQAHPQHQSNSGALGVIRYSAVKMMRFGINHNRSYGTEPQEVQVAGHVINGGPGKKVTSSGCIKWRLSTFLTSFTSSVSLMRSSAHICYMSSKWKHKIFRFWQVWQFYHNSLKLR